MCCGSSQSEDKSIWSPSDARIKVLADKPVADEGERESMLRNPAQAEQTKFFKN
jgi:hypothetical protein